ncbi:MAG: protein translocase subunit SecD [Pirellulaceae bacterium]
MNGLSMIELMPSLMLLAQAQAAAGDAADAGAAVANATDWTAIGTNVAFVLGIFVLPFVVSHFVTKAIRMPTHSFRLGLMLAAVTAAFLFAWSNNFQLTLGPDMKGGTTLVYDIMKGDDGQKVNAGSLSTALSDRINPSGTKEISIRPRGESQIEITVPNVDPLELDRIKSMIGDAGQLEFRIVANSRDHADIIQLAKRQAVENKVPKAIVTAADGREVGRWVTVARDAKKVEGVYPLKSPVLSDVREGAVRNTLTGEAITAPVVLDEAYALEKWMDREGIRDVDILMAYEFAGNSYSVVNGDDLASAATAFGKSGYEVEFRLDTFGSDKMLRLTAANQPDGAFKRRMAIIMDNKMLSAPQLNSPISTNGVIQGQFAKEEVEFLVTILRAGRLPATLSSEPASEARVGAGLGATTVEKGKNASIFAVIATFVCILLYYRFAGAVASLALLINGLLIFGVMIFISQPLTLPGLAGLVLTIGMSVDANVLIFERIREEKQKGSAPRMSIRNGFDRAFTTIIDANVTTLIAAIVLYWIGTDQVRGFAVALIIGIVTSVFTATFCSRIVFEIAEKLKLVSLSMSDGVGFLKKSFLGDRDINFMGWQTLCFGLSILLIALGLVGVTMRGQDLLNIDFTGGTSVTFQLTDAVQADDLREITKRILVKDEEDKPVQSKLVRVEKPPADTVYTLVTSIKDESYLSKLLVEGFAAEPTTDLKTYKVEIMGPGSSGAMVEKSRTMFVSYTQDAQDTQATETAASEATQAATTTDPSSTSDENSTTEATGEVASDEDMAVAVPTEPVDVKTTVMLQFSGSTDEESEGDANKGASVTGISLRDKLVEAAENAGVEINQAAIEIMPEPMPENWRLEDVSGFADWKVTLPADQATADTVVEQLKQDLTAEPLWLSLSKIGSKVAGEMQQRAVAAILVSLVFIVAYIWFRFQKVAYGLAAVVALVHDVLITLGVLALCHWLAGPLSFLMIEDFKIGLTEIAAFLTIIGYSLNDTIVVFDRIREVRGRSPQLTEKMVNESVNQTLSRTLLTSGTTLVTVLLLYIFGGEGIHAFAFALLIGVIVGTYSSIFIAAPSLLWISKRENKKRSVTA